MARLPQEYLFDWQDVDSGSDLDRLRLVLQAIPDEPLVDKLEAHRDRGRNEYPVRPTWNSILAGVVFQHPSIASLRRELKRNGELRKLCGFDPLVGERAVPTDSAYSNFCETLLNHESDIRALFHDLVERLREKLPELGKFTAVDGKALASFGKPPKKEAGTEQGEDTVPDRRRDEDADWGVKTYRGKRADGTTWEKVVKWFGFELHLLVDSVHEMPLNYKVTQASAAETIELIPLVEQTQELHPEVIQNCRELSADKGYDSTESIKTLWDDWGIRAIIDKKADWKDPDPTRPLFPDRVDTIVYDVKGEISCVCPATGEIRSMVYWGFESDRQRLKYRCPAAVYGLECKGRAGCPGAQGDYGRIVRIPIEMDRRMFTPVARDSDAWKRGYARRTAVERVNSRLDQLLGFERHTIRGLKKMEARVGIALIVLLAMALGRIQAGQLDQMRSLVAPVKRAA